MTDQFRLDPPEYGDHLAGIWMLDRVWATERSLGAVGILFYSRAFYKKVEVAQRADGSLGTFVQGFTYFIQGNQIMSFSMDEPLDVDRPMTDEELEAAASEWKYDGKNLWIFESDWLPFHQSTLQDLIDAGIDRETLIQCAVKVGLADPDFNRKVDKLPLPGKHSL